jgi:hypothetical protein
MTQLIQLLKVFHHLALLLLLISFAIIPLLMESVSIRFLIYLPIIFILLAIVGVYIEHALNKYQKRQNSPLKLKRPRHCLANFKKCCSQY